MLKRLTLKTKKLGKASLQSSAGLDTKKMGSELSTELAKLEVS